MCAYSDLVFDIQKRLNDVTLHRGEIKVVEVIENGALKAVSLVVSSSGLMYKFEEKIDVVQQGVGLVRKVFMVGQDQRVNYELPLAAKIYPLRSLLVKRKGDDFIQEILVHSALSKIALESCVPGIVPIQECLYTEDSLVMMMPFYNKKDLFYYLTQNSELLPVATVKSIFRRLINVLALMHDNGYIHRDISCENVYINGEVDVPHEVCKKAKKESENTFDLGDFGMSAHLSEVAGLCQKIGKPSYKSPELTKEKIQTAEEWKANDVWALGVVLYLLLMKAFPFAQARPCDPLFVDRIVKGQIEMRGRLELSRSCYATTVAKEDMEERLQGLRVVQRMLMFHAADRATAAAIRDDAWLQEEFLSKLSLTAAAAGVSSSVGNSTTTAATAAMVVALTVNPLVGPSLGNQFAMMIENAQSLSTESDNNHSTTGGAAYSTHEAA